VAGRFPLYADADIHGPVVEGLRRRGWDVVRAVDLHPEGADDHVHFERAALEGRVLVSNDLDQLMIAESWLLAGRCFSGLVTWHKVDERRMTVGFRLDVFEALAEEDEPFPSSYPIIRIKPSSRPG
jgi:hypothetical protein